MSASRVFVKNKIEFQYIPDQQKILIYDVKNDKALRTYALSNQSEELDKDTFITLCLNIRDQIEKVRRTKNI